MIWPLTVAASADWSMDTAAGSGASSPPQPASATEAHRNRADTQRKRDPKAIQRLLKLQKAVRVSSAWPVVGLTLGMLVLTSRQGASRVTSRIVPGEFAVCRLCSRGRVIPPYTRVT